MLVRILGPIEIEAGPGGAGRAPQGAKLQTILAILALEAGRSVPTHTLADRLWGQRPERWRETLPVYISRLRTSLAAADIAITTTAAGGYRLELDPAATDLHRFDELVRAARDAAALGSAEQTRGLLAEAEQVWRGEALTGANGSWAEHTRARLHEDRATALSALIALDLALPAQRPTAIGELARLTEAARPDPRVFELLAEALDEEGRDRQAREVRSRARAQPYRARPLPATPLRPSVRERAAAALLPRTRLPAPAPLIGREELLHTLLAALTRDLRAPSACALHAIDGPPGIGKSALALRAAHELAPQITGAALHLSLSAPGHQPRPLTAHEVLRELIERLGPADAARGQTGAQELARLWHTGPAGPGPVVLVLDDAHSPDQIAPLLPPPPGTAVIVTSRSRLAPLPGAQHLTLGPISDLAAIRLARREADWHAPVPSRAQRKLAAFCAGHPLAAALAGAHLRIHPAMSVPDYTKAAAAAAAGARDSAVPAPVLGALAVSLRALSAAHLLTLRTLAEHGAHPLGCAQVAEATDTGRQLATGLCDQLVSARLAEEAAPAAYRVPALIRQALPAAARAGGGPG